MPLNLRKIRELMRRRTQGEVAAAAGMPRPSLARLLGGRYPDVPISTVEKLAKALGCEPGRLLK